MYTNVAFKMIDPSPAEATLAIKKFSHVNAPNIIVDAKR